MKNGSLIFCYGIVVLFLFLWGGSHAETPGSHAPGMPGESLLLQDVKAAREYIKMAGRDLQRAERKMEEVGRSIAGMVREVTAYNVGVRAQTSDTPCIGASGRDLCELVARNVKVCAANFVPFGTILKIDTWGECIVLDRMHPRFSHRVDIAMSEDEIEEARRFGLKKRLVKAMF